MAEQTKREAFVVDDADPMKLDAIYYSAPVPRGAVPLTVAGVIFDRLIFPGVHLPSDGFDRAALEAEIKRLKGIRNIGRDDVLLPALEFVRHSKTLEGFCVFTGGADDVFGGAGNTPKEFVNQIYEAIHGLPKPGWTPWFDNGHHKGLPGSDEFIGYPGTYHYLGNALIESARTGIPVLNDLPGLPIPGLADASPQDNARLLSGILAIECVNLVLSGLPPMQPTELMEFREENKALLRVFRRSMLRYAADLNDKISGLDPKEIATKAEFFIHTEIAPALDEIREAVRSPTRSWGKRLLDGISVLPQVGAAFFTMEPKAALAAVFTTYAGQFFQEMYAKSDKKEALKRSGLYYLLKLEQTKKD